jgi:glycosyltransferase involved in cell wall biosynthesis
MAKVGVYLGSNTEDVSNIHNVLTTWVSALSEASHEIDLIGGTNIPNTISSEVTLRDGPNIRARTPFGSIINSYSYISRYISEYSPDVLIQLWKYQTHAPAVSLAGKKERVPTVARLTGNVFLEYQGYSLPFSAGIFILDNVITRIPLRTASKIVALGPNLKTAALSRGADEQGIHVIPPPTPDKELFSYQKREKEIKAELDLELNRPVALYVGRISKQKGMEFLASVIKKTLPQTRFQFVLVGSGSYQNKIRNQFSDEDVKLPGYVPRSQIGKYYRAATVYIHPSRFEGLPLVILEALQSGTPVVAREAGDVGFVLGNMVTTEEEMSSRLIRRSWNELWRNKTFFTPEYQRREITSLIDDLFT